MADFNTCICWAFYIASDDDEDGSDTSFDEQVGEEVQKNWKRKNGKSREMGESENRERI